MDLDNRNYKYLINNWAMINDFVNGGF